jgi:hypothetical protein
MFVFGVAPIARQHCGCKQVRIAVSESGRFDLSLTLYMTVKSVKCEAEV